MLTPKLFPKEWYPLTYKIQNGSGAGQHAGRNLGSFNSFSRRRLNSVFLDPFCGLAIQGFRPYGFG
jgi:hypothetical protein